jgi:hypothetical protein
MEYSNSRTAEARIYSDPRKDLFRSKAKTDRLSDRAIFRFDVLRHDQSGVSACAPYSAYCHTFRAIGLTIYLQNASTLKHAETTGKLCAI